MIDQYGDWNYTYDGIVPIVIPDYFVTHHAP